MDSLKSITQKRHEKKEDFNDSLDNIEEELDEDDPLSSSAAKNSGGNNIERKMTRRTTTSLPILNKIKNNIVELLEALINEIEDIQEEISKQAKEHIQDNHMILTYGKSSVLEKFLVVSTINIYPL
jgi:translation initiation factor 2B subunit (eIF-2B alpha/beta/delta family)